MSRILSLSRLLSASAIGLSLLVACGSGSENDNGTTASEATNAAAAAGVNGTSGASNGTATEGASTETATSSTLPLPSKPSPGGTGTTHATVSELTKPIITSGGGNGVETPDTSAIQGFWDFSTTEGPVDTLYEKITADGQISYFDWDNDDYGTGRKCFNVETYSFKPLGDDRYLFDETVLTMVVVGDRLLVSEAGGPVLSFPERQAIDSSLLVRCD